MYETISPLTTSEDDPVTEAAVVPSYVFVVTANVAVSGLAVIEPVELPALLAKT